MSTLDQGLYAHLSAKTAVTDLVGTRIYPHRAPQNAQMPFVAVYLIGDAPLHHMGGASALAYESWQVSVFGETNDSVIAVKEAIRLAMDGAKNTTFGDVSVRSCVMTGNRALYLSDEDGAETGVFQWTLDFSIGHVRSVPVFA